MVNTSTLAPQLQRQVNKLFDAVRSNSGNYACISIPVLILGMRLFDISDPSSNWPYSLVDLLHRRISESNRNDILPIVRQLEQSTSQMNRNILDRIQMDILEFDLLTLPQAEFEILLDYVIERAFKLLSGRIGEWKLPGELMELLTSVYDVRPGMSIYNPYAGTAGLISYLDKSVSYTGQEYDDTALLLGTIRLIGYQRTSSILSRGNVFEPWSTYFKPDLTICSRPLPVSRTTTSSGYSQFGYNVPTDIVFVDNILQHLAPRGKAIILMTANSLWQSAKVYQHFRQYLAESGALEAVLEFPSGVIPDSSVRLAVLLLNYERTNRSQTLLIDAESFVQRKGRVHTIDTPALLATLANSNQTSAARMVEVPELAEQGYSLSPRRYLVSLEPAENQTRLKLIAKPITKRVAIPTEQQLPTEVRLLRIRNLKAEGADFTLTTEDIPYEFLEERRNIVPLAQSALLIALQGGTLKPTWYEHQNDEIVYLPPYILPLTPSSKVELSYLVAELNSDFVRKQLYAFSTGAAIPAIRKSDALNIIIRLPSRREQEAIAADVRSQVIKAALEEVQTAKDDAYAQFAALKHALGKPLSTLSNGLLLLEFTLDRYAQQSSILSLDSPMNPDAASTTTVRETINMMKDARKFMFDTIRMDEAELRVKSYSLESVEIVDYMKRKVSSVRASEPGFAISPVMEFFTVKGDEKQVWGLLRVYVQANLTLLNRLFDTIFDNAFRHGFLSEWSAENKVQVWMRLENSPDGQSFVNISIHNNGTPLTAGWDVNRLFIRGAHAGKTGHSGIGGYEAKEIVDYFRGTIQIRPSELDNFTVCYTIVLPISETEIQDV